MLCSQRRACAVHKSLEKTFAYTAREPRACKREGRRRRYGKLAGARTGGGGLQRLVVGKFLKGMRYKTCEERREYLTAANGEAMRLGAEGGPQLDALKKGALAGTISHRNGGSSTFGDGPYLLKKKTQPQMMP